MLAKMVNRLREWVRLASSFYQVRSIKDQDPQKDHIWSIGIYTGTSPFSFEAPPNVTNPVLAAKDVSDVRASMIGAIFMKLGRAPAIRSIRFTI